MANDLIGQLEAWRKVDPAARYYALQHFPHPDATDRIRLCLSNGADYIWAYDCEQGSRPRHKLMIYLGSAERRAEVDEVILAGLRAWKELYGE